MDKRLFYLISILILILVIGFSTKSGSVDSIDKDNSSLQLMREDAELGMTFLDDLEKVPSISHDRVSEIEKISDKKADFYRSFKSSDRTELEIAMNLASGFSMTSRSVKEYKYDETAAEHDYEEAVEDFCNVLRMFNKMNLK